MAAASRLTSRELAVIPLMPASLPVDKAWEARSIVPVSSPEKWPSPDRCPAPMKGASMASIAITGVTPPSATQSIGTVNVAQEPVQAATSLPKTLQPDTVTLSVAAQAKMMHRAGQSPSLIAATLGTNVAAVDGYLNIKVAPQPAATPALPSAEQAAPAAESRSTTQPDPNTQPVTPASTTPGVSKK